ncbi:MAG: hypothetical protein LBS59_09530 [Puniceicoccales bacterium]|jgi:hypothetical protein|nr:hypothetical protein [Puniceicoccales bacterium]
MDSCIQQIQWVGTSRSLVKNLPAFDKKRHSVPETASPTTAAFLSKLIAPQINADAETFFQKTRTALEYKRTDISLSSGTGSALLTTRDFSIEWNSTLDPSNPSEWSRSFTLHSLHKLSVLESPRFNALLDAAFTTLEFTLHKPVCIEAVIDAVEALDPTPETGAPPIEITYPSHYAYCTLHVHGISATVVFSGSGLRMEFAQPGSPKELADAFDRTRHAFDLTGSASLSSLVRRAAQ